MRVHVVLDVEMCRVRTKKAVYPCRNEIIQIGAVMMDDAYRILDKFSTYVRPRFGQIDHYIAELTGISKKTIKEPPNN